MKFLVKYTIEAQDRNEALQLAHRALFTGDIDADNVSVSPVSGGEVPTETSPLHFERIFTGDSRDR